LDNWKFKESEILVDGLNSSSGESAGGDARHPENKGNGKRRFHEQRAITYISRKGKGGYRN